MAKQKNESDKFDWYMDHFDEEFLSRKTLNQYVLKSDSHYNRLFIRRAQDGNFIDYIETEHATYLNPLNLGLIFGDAK